MLLYMYICVCVWGGWVLAL